MSFAEILLIGIGLAMDAFAVSVTNGMCKRGKTAYIAVFCGLCFGIFQGLMPSAGYALGSTFARFITKYDHIIALVLLSFIGGKMIFDAFRGGENKAFDGTLKPTELILQGVATSIDALAVGVSFSTLLSVSQMISAAAVIAAVTFIISFAGVIIGKKFGDVLSNKAQIVGGIILIGIGIKIFIEHTFFS